MHLSKFSFNIKTFLKYYILYEAGLVWWHVNISRLLNANSFLYIYIKYMIYKHILLIASLKEPVHIFSHR